MASGYHVGQGSEKISVSRSVSSKYAVLQGAMKCQDINPLAIGACPHKLAYHF